MQLMCSFKKRLPSFFLLLTLLFTSFYFASPARADVAPPEQPPGTNPLPGAEVTRVRMMAETVLIDVALNAPTGSLGVAQVTADFTMHNVGEASETMAVRFPLSANDGFFNFPEITELEVRVDGQLVTTREIEVPDKFNDPITWAEFDVTFPSGEDVFIQVTYTLEATGEYPFISFKYLLETGAGWQGTIGEGDLIVRLPYPVDDLNVIFNQQIGWSETTPGGTLVENEVHWNFKNLEPSFEDNFEVSLVMPSAWQKVMAERANVENNPQDGEAWGRLGKIYKEIGRLRRGLREDVGGQGLYLLSQEAYEKAITLLPNDALWHAGYADLLWVHYYYDVYFSDQPDPTEIIRILELLNRSLALSPGNSVAVNLLTEMTYSIPEAVEMDGDQFILHYLTATPFIEPSATSTPSPTETPTLTETSTPLPQDTATALPTHTQSPTEPPLPTNTPLPASGPTSTLPPTPASPGIPFCGAALLIFLPALHRRKRR